MPATKMNGFRPGILYDNDGNVISSTLVAGIRRLAVDASLSVSEIQIGAVELDDAEGSSRAQIKEDGVPFATLLTDQGGLLIAGRDNTGPTHRHIRVNSLGQIITAPAASPPPGATITTPADTPVPVTGTVALPVPPAGTLRMMVQNTSSGTFVRIREVLAGAGRGHLLPFLGSREYGGAGGAVAALEAQHISGGPSTVMVQFEGP